MLRLLWISIFMILIETTISAQYFEKQKDTTKLKKLKEHIVFGGEFQIGFGTITDIYLSPTAGYLIKPWLLTAASLKFEYYRNKLIGMKDINYGGSIFTEIYPLKFIALHTETIALNLTNYNTGNRIWVATIFAGGGYRQAFGKKSMANYLLLFNVLKNPYYPPYMWRIILLF